MALDSARRKPHSTVPAVIPGDRGLPLVGHTFSVLKGKYYTDRSRYDRYGPVTRMRAFGMNGVMVQGPDGVGEVLQNKDHAFASGPGWSFLIGPLDRKSVV